MDNRTLVYLEPEVAVKFVLFQQYFTPFTVLLECNFFEQSAATLVVRMDKDKKIRDISRTDLLYSFDLNLQKLI